MKPFETYVERGVSIDPYAFFADAGTRIRLQGGRRSLVGYSSRMASPTDARVRPTPLWPQGSLPSTTWISKSRAGRPEGLTELLRALVAVRVKADPYVEIGAQLQAAITEILKPTVSPSRPDQRASLDDFLRPVLQLEKGGQLDPALDVLYDRVNDLLKARNFSALDMLLRQVDADAFSVDILLGLLTASLPAKSKLPSRSKFYAKAEASIKQRGEWEEGLLTGLES
jgi:hypothetical protein